MTGPAMVGGWFVLLEPGTTDFATDGCYSIYVVRARSFGRVKALTRR